jgi:hypothetical protein
MGSADCTSTLNPVAIISHHRGSDSSGKPVFAKTVSAGRPDLNFNHFVVGTAGLQRIARCFTTFGITKAVYGAAAHIKFKNGKTVSLTASLIAFYFETNLP